MAMKFGFQTYTWQMSYEKHRDKLEHILDIVQQAGGAGVEPEVCMLGPYNDDPQALVNALEERGLKLGALCLALDWREAGETVEEKAEADRIIRFLKHFPGTLLTLVQLPGKDRSELALRQRNALLSINAVARRAYEAGIECAYHPNSPSGSIFRIEEDYRVLLDGIDSRYCGYAPDTGHIVKGGMDAETIFRTYRPLIRHVHFKDMNLVSGQWSALGQGSIDHKAIVRYLQETGYDGWVMVEEESQEAELQPDRVTLQNGIYVREELAILA
ncbi:sugar phosphate isomerase/epimerase family protein [Paenibacillus radicis (ex Gao et al. 2016)]|uniref:Xylose isomerase n=1 Tax=Paenibacillus radicis (ex Gao et al. 2016) TaxID=1737354 RepID=A0A917GXY9_9BACL|nr:sugar phosphate isomerase/epimerase [Paenibacillus radicis (ex Gao et al. 2016)]GGG60666.1 xylose isomerase [Paenibacillus radicis (ex Gao et al. 2016)]